MSRSRYWFNSAVVVTLVLSFAALVQAENSVSTTQTSTATTQNPAPSRTDSADALLDVLQVFQSKGMLTQQEYESLKRRVEAAKAQEEATVPQLQPAALKTEEGATPPDVSKKIVTALDKGIGFRVDGVDVHISGEFNAFYVHDRSTKSVPASVLGLASTQAIPNSSIRNGLLPGNFTVSLTTQQKGYDIGVVFGFWPGIQSLQTGQNMLGPTYGGVNLAPGNPTGFGVAGIDFRQQFATIGKPSMGTFKLGRDLGFFAQEAIFNDITLLGAGTTNGNAGPGSVTLGRIGLGYVYTDFIPQISYMSPSKSGFQAGFGVFAPLNDVISTTLGLGPDSSLPLSAKLTGHGEPQFQGKLTYTVPAKGLVKAKLWSNFLTQKMEANLGEGMPNIPVGKGIRAKAVDFGAKVSIGAADLVAYGYKGWGLGTEGLFFLAATPTGHLRNSQGYYYQGTYTVAKKLTFGASYGLSHLFLASGDGPEGISPLVKSNSSYVGQARYGLTKWVNLVTEYTHTISQGHNGVHTTSDSVAAGTILFF